MGKRKVQLIPALFLTCVALSGCGNGGNTSSSASISQATSGTTATSSSQTTSATTATSSSQTTSATSSVIASYTITFMNGESVYHTYQLNKGEQIVPPEQNPTKSEPGYTFTFIGWSEDGLNVVSEFPLANENKTYFALYESDVTTFTATVHFDYAEGPEDQYITYTCLDDLSAKANEVKNLLPINTEEYSYSWLEEVPNSLPLENKTYTVIKTSIYFTVDMSSPNVDDHLKFIKRSDEGTPTGMEMVNNTIQITTSNDNFIVKNNYTNFDLSFKMKMKNNDRFVLVLGTNEDNMKLAHTSDNDVNATNGVVGVTLVPSHASCSVRLNSDKGTVQRTPLHIDTTYGFNKNDGVNVKVRMRGYKCEIFFEGQIVDAITFTEDQFTPGKQIGFGFSNNDVVTISQFSIQKFTDTSFSHKMENLGRATEQLVPFGDGSSTSYNSSTKALEFPALGHRKMVSFHQISSDFKLVLNIKYSGNASDRVDLLFGMQESDLNTTFAGGQNNSHDEHPGVMNALIAPNHDTSNVRLFYNGIAENQFARKIDKADLTTTFVKMEVSCYQGLFTFKINDQENNTYQLPDTDFPERGYFGICSGNGNGTISITEISLTDCYNGKLSEKEKQATIKAMSMNVCTVCGFAPAIPGQPSDVEGDENDYVQVTVKQLTNVDGEKFDVDIEWTYVGFESDVTRYRTVDGDDRHKNFEFKFPEVGAADKAIEIVGTPSIDGKKGDAVKFVFNLKAMKLVFPEWSIAEIYKIKNDGSMFSHISDPVKGYFESNQNPDVTPYCCVKTYGEVIYLAPDGNWGLLADGDKFIELYAGSAYNLNTKTYADLKLNEKVYVYGEPTHYQGNIQFGYISKVEKMSDPQKVQDIVDAKAIDGSYLSTTGQICQDMNRLVSLTGVFKSKAMPSTDISRGTFVVTVDGVELEIFYDYHTSKEGSSTLYEEIMTIVNSAVKDTTRINIKGTLRWVNTGGDIFGGAGHWTVAPYASGHVTQ